MKTKRLLSREYAVHMMYHVSVGNASSDEVLHFFRFSHGEDEKFVMDFAEDLFHKAYKNMDYNDELVRKYLKKGWSYDRLGEVEKAVFRVALAELFEGDAPVYAILDDYVSIASSYMDEKSASLVNGILDKIKSEFNIDRDRV